MKALPLHDQFDAVFHLAGDQALLTYAGMKQFSCKRHVIAVTGRTRRAAESIMAAMPTGVDIQLLEIPEHDLPAAVLTIQGATKDPLAKWCFNATGGTKAMFAAVYHAAACSNSPLFYVESAGKTMNWLMPQPAVEPMRPAFTAIDEFLRLAGFTIDRSSSEEAIGRAVGRQVLVERCWKERALLAQSSRRIAGDTRCRAMVPFKYGDVTRDNSDFAAELKGPDASSAGVLRIRERAFQYAPWPDLAAFIAGGWFDDEVMIGMKKLLDQGRIKDLVCHVLPKQAATPDEDLAIDVAFTDGHSLTIIACIPAEVKHDQLQRLDGVAKRLGGYSGRGIFVCADPRKIDDGIRRRISHSGTLCAVSWARVVNGPVALLTVTPGTVML